MKLLATRNLLAGRSAALALCLCLLVAGALPAPASVRLEFNPEDQTVPLGETGILSVITTVPLEIRTIELWVEYDAELLQSLGGAPGKRFVDSGCTLFPDFTDSVPGEWYGTVITIGFDCWAVGPGELYRWDFLTLQNGISPIVAAQVRLYDPLGELIDEIELAPTSVVAGVGTAAPTIPAAPASLSLHPNPFNPRTQLRFRSTSAGPARLELFDPNGRRLALLWEGWLDESETTVEWSGRDSRDRDLPSGVYCFRLSGEACGVRTLRGILLE